MQIDTEHLHHWMSAVRISNNPMRTLDAFWSGQIKSKEWLIDKLGFWVRQEASVDIHGGWVGVLASMLFQSNIPISKIRNIDIDPTVSHVAIEMNRIEHTEMRFDSITSNMCNVHSDYDIVINTSCEHLTQTDYDVWLDKIPEQTLLVLQSNNYNIPEHVRIADSLSQFEQQSNIEIWWSGELSLPLYNRYMIIGKKK